MENWMMTRIANKIADKLNWEYVGECEKLKMVEDVLDEFTSLMEKSIMNIVEE